jgi:hypothetical protein
LKESLNNGSKSGFDNSKLIQDKIMKINFHNIATYTALILISSLPLSADTFTGADKKSSSIVLSNDDKEATETRSKLLKEKRNKLKIKYYA